MTEKQTTPGSGPARSWLLLAAAVFLLLLQLAGAAWGGGGARLWGVNAAWYLPDGWIAVIALALLAAVGSAFSSSMTTMLAPDTPRDLSWGLVLTGVLLAAGVSWYAPVAFAFLGDGTWYAAEMYRRVMDPTYATSMVKPSAWLTGHLLEFLARWTDAGDVRVPFRVLGAAGAAIAVAAVLLAFRRERTWLRGYAVVFFLLGGGSLMFFGYIELYALLYALVIAYLAASWAVFRRGLAAWVPGALLIAAALFGATALFLLPSYLLLLHWKVRGEHAGPITLQRAAVLLAALPLLAVLLAYAVTGTASDNPYLVALVPYERVFHGMSVGWQRYVLTLPARWADMLNALLLAAGVPMSLLAAILILPAARRTGTSPLLLFGMVVFVSSAVLLVFGNSFLGLARDWDLASIPATAMAFLTLAFLATPEKGLRLAYRRVFPAALIAALCSFVLWQQVNADEDASASRFSDIVAMDSGLLLPMNTYTARENLRKFYRAEGLTPAYFSVLQQMAETGYHKPATYSEYLSSALQLQDTRAREEHITWLLGRLEAEASSTFPADDYRRIDERTLRELSTRVLLTLAQTGEQSRVDEWTKRLQPRLDPWPELLLVQIVNGDYTGALPVTEAAAAAVDSATTDPFLIMTVGGICEQHGAYARAASWYRRALRMEPKTYPSWYLVAARLYADRLGDIAAAKDVLEQCIRAVPDTREAASARDILSRFP